MMKNKSLLVMAALVLCASCAHKAEVVNYCPNVSISPLHNKVINNRNSSLVYKVEVVGYEGYCKYNPKTNTTKAYIEPIFEVTNSAEYGFNVIGISYFVDTTENPGAAMGKQLHSTDIKVPTDGKKVLRNGDKIELRIPNDMPEYKVVLGMGGNEGEQKAGQRQGTFGKFRK